jgi:DNA repair exonuclease SbcCD nuclease subunit
MKIAIVTDTHFGARNDSQLFMNHFASFFEETFFPTIKERNINTVIHAGDLLDRRKFINFNTLSQVREKFIKPLKDMDITVHCILGNHDTYYKNTNELNSLNELFNNDKNFILHQNPTDVNFGGMQIALLPWINRENKDEFHDFVKNTKSEWLIGHLELNGYEVLRGIKYDGGTDPEIFKRFEQVLSGHFHCQQERGNIKYLGTPYQITFSDLGEKKGFYILDTDTRELEFIENKKEMFYSIKYDDVASNYDKFIQKTHSKYKDAYVKIFVLNKEKPHVLDRVIDSLYNSGVYNLTIVEDVDPMSYSTEDISESDMSKSTLELILDEVGKMKDINNPDKVKKLLKELYMESLKV